ncbi:dihydrolipoyl dehydrogenase [Candidatus Puniceispirillum marinum]|uniref:Dihydrolipoyl dehydrogenase n=1 Tax=Puniceispirillum marinum (strain IMCC1322) TaxID=488538 RepID=D5BPG9_PUNMI|nr:dihydrolipoyl dehydrogenase [Candidatus Puniceispirillum marinum]ADE38451.1 Pyruvate/2-oxoglutarate dehydrogenase complex, dihydrolipoamide dehydrogenase (E3) component, and related enzyme [Candidatus Puniceispirillum marinum IMCC1322]
MAETKSDTKSFDIIVIGGGPGGYVAAIRASQLGMKAAVIEREHLGGVCLNWGCIPTKALLRAAELRHSIDEMKEFGITISGEVGIDLPTVVKRSRKVAGRLSMGVSHLLKKNKVTVFEAEAKIGAKKGDIRTVTLADGTILQAKHVIIATGARARSLPDITPDGKTILTYKEAMVPESMPESLIIIGSGAIGSEFASFYHDMGVKVTLVEAVDRILPVEDPEISAIVQKAFVKRGMQVITGVMMASLKSNGKSVTATFDGTQEPVTADRAILAVGIIGNTENLGLDGTKVKVDRGHITTNQWAETGEAGIYAIGDVTGPPWLAHKASHEGIICVEKIAGQKDVHAIGAGAVPGCTYCRPQVASVGMTEAAAKEAGHKIKVGRFPFIGNGKAIAMGDDQGLIKTIFDEKTGELLGAHMVGPEVTELIQGYAIARTLEATEAELMQTIFPHPTLSEAMHESVLDAYGRAIHM